MAVRSGVYSIGINSAEFRHFRDGSGERLFRERINFNPPLPPNVGIAVQASISGLDIEKAANARLSVSTEKVDKDGFDLVIYTWGDTRIWSVAASWVAHTIE